MTVFRLSEDLVFPPAELAEPDGLLAVGGDLRPERLLLAYRQGIFPWYLQGQPICWFSPARRMVLRTDSLRIDRGQRRTLGRTRLRLSLDCAFDRVIHYCAVIARPEGQGTWITAEMKRAYCRLHELGYAHSAEAWDGQRLLGGVYGVSIGGLFSAESMFYRQSGASLAALVALILQLDRWGIRLFDCQLYSAHTARLGAGQWSRAEFLRALLDALELPTRRSSWDFSPELLRELPWRGRAEGKTVRF